MKSNLTAVAIVIGFSLVAAAIYFSGDVTATSNGPERGTKDSHVYGEKNASVTIVEFSDFECPFCSRVHPVLKQIVDESDGDIKWEYRHFPLPSHRNAEYAARVAECVGQELGNTAFWEYADTVFGHQGQVSEIYLKKTALALGLDDETVEECLVDSVIISQISTDLSAGRAYGGSGTPFSVIVFADGSIKPVSGALPYEQWKILLNL